ncbi:MAG: hypothetical protein ACREVL_05420, partial [Solimonas sp.]
FQPDADRTGLDGTDRIATGGAKECALRDKKWLGALISFPHNGGIEDSGGVPGIERNPSGRPG